MKPLKSLSISTMALALLACSLPVGCANLPGTPPAETSSASNSSTAAITGIVFTGRSIDNRLVPPSSPVSVQVLESENVIASVDTDNLGRFFLGDIPVPTEGKSYTIRVGSLFEEQRTLFPGRTLNLSSIQASSLSNNVQEAKVVSGTLINAQSQPLANVTVRDKNFDFRSVTTNDAGEFALEVVSEELEVIISEAQPPIPIAVSELQRSRILTVETDNIRTISGIVQDSTNSNINLAGAKIRIQGRGTSTTSGPDGRYTLNGAPVGPFILEVTPEDTDGYSPFSVQVAPATFDAQNQPIDLEQDIFLQPIGSILVNIHVEDAPDFNRLSCDVTINCRRYDINSQDGTPEDYYHNGLGTLNTRQATIAVEGTDIVQEVEYPSAPLLTLRGTSVDGDLLTLDEAVTGRNVVVSVRLDRVPGGKQNITVSMTGMQTQKSIPIFVPPNDTISTDLITLYYVQQVNSLGDISGVIKGLDPESPETIRIGYLDTTENQIIEPRLGDRTDPFLLDRILQAVTSPRSVEVNKDTGRYYVPDAPTGTRVTLAAAVIDETGGLSDCYIPNTSVLLNVRASQVNFAPDLELVKRKDTPGCE